MALKKSNDHWDFLEEIEAPTWVDLAAEAKSSYEDIDDEWFHTNHLFHQCSSSHLKSAFSHSGEGSSVLDFESQRPSSPKLPSSVSRSRGKHYRSREWGKENHPVKKHPVKSLSGKPSFVESGSHQEIKPKSSIVNLKEIARSKRSLGCRISSTGNAIPNHCKPISIFGGAESSLSSTANRAGEYNTTSTITGESSKQRQKFLDVSSQAFGNTSELLTVMRNSLRKSCVTRQASRVEINDRRESKGQKSSSGKSSVGSSSHPGYNVKSSTVTVTRNRDITPDSKNVIRISQAAKNRVKVPNVRNRDRMPDSKNVVRTSQAAKNGVKVSNVSKGSDSRKGGKINIAKSTNQEAAKSKVQCQTLFTKALLPLRVNEQNTFSVATKTKEKVGVSGRNKLAGPGKENAAGRMAASQKCSSRDIAGGGMVRDQTGMKRSVPIKGDRIGLVGSKGNIDDQSGRKHLMNVHLR